MPLLLQLILYIFCLRVAISSVRMAYRWIKAGLQRIEKEVTKKIEGETKTITIVGGKVE